MSDKCLTCFNRSFASSDKAEFWSAKNDKTPREVARTSSKKFIFECAECGHEFSSSLSNVSAGKWCPYCVNKLCPDKKCQICFSKSFASSDKAKYWSPKNKTTPRDVFLRTGKKYLFDCHQCGHEFLAMLTNLYKGCWCPYCSDPPQKLCENEGCTDCFNKSFASFPKAKFWSSKNKVNARSIFLMANAKHWFDCDKCGHSFDMRPADIVSKNNWCRYCSGKDSCDDKDCEYCFNRSFASEDMTKNWSKLNTTNPRDVRKCSAKKYLFDCDKCQHSFYSSLDHVTISGRGCPFCAGQKICKDDKCSKCFVKSFASSPRAKNWSSKNKTAPRDIFIRSKIKYLFDCEECDSEFRAAPTEIFRGTWCPICKHKTEKDLLRYLQLIFPDVQHQARFEWAKNPSTSKILPYDFCLPSRNILIELDGPQHFRQVAKWTPPEETQERDLLKEELAVDHGYSVIRLLQTDVRDDKNQWREKLDAAIQYISDQPKILHIYTERITDISYVYELNFISASTI
jgi:hypothetical protein